MFGWYQTIEPERATNKIQMIKCKHQAETASNMLDLSAGTDSTSGKKTTSWGTGVCKMALIYIWF